MIKQLTISALTGGVLMLGYAAWNKWRPSPLPRVERGPVADALELDFDELLPPEVLRLNPNEQLVDFSAEPAQDEEEGPVAPEDLGVRWLTRATEALSPFGHGQALQQEAEAAALNEVAQRASELVEAAPDSEPWPESVDWDLELPTKKRR